MLQEEKMAARLDYLNLDYFKDAVISGECSYMDVERVTLDEISGQLLIIYFLSEQYLPDTESEKEELSFTHEVYRPLTNWTVTKPETALKRPRCWQGR